MAEFVFEGATFKIELTLKEWDDQSPVVELPFFGKTREVRYIEAYKWFPTVPPRPSVIEELLDKLDILLEDDRTLVKAVLVSEAPEPVIITEPLTHKQVRDLVRHQRLRFKFRLPFEEYLDFTIGGFLGWIELQYLHGSVRGNLRDVKYRPIEIIGHDLVIEIDCDPRSLH